VSDESRSTLDSIERFVKVLKEVTLLGVIVYLAWYLVPFVPKWVTKLDSAQISEISLAGVGFKLAQVEQKLQQVVTSDAARKSANDERVTPDKRLIAEALESVRSVTAQTSGRLESPAQSTSDTSFWVYLGAAKGSSLPQRIFRTSELPKEGQVIQAATDVYQRKSAPVYRMELVGSWATR